MTTQVFLLILVIAFILDVSVCEIIERSKREQIATCSMECEGQWKSEFEMNFQKLFDTSYFEVPIDPVILGSLATLRSFCSSTKQKFKCLREECGIKKNSWSPERYVCLEKLDKFEKNIKCLQKTNPVVQKQCLEACSNLTTEFSTQELNYMRGLRLTNGEKAVFYEQNRHCHFIGCHQMCHDFVISKACPLQTTETRSTINEYYNEYLKLEHQSLVDEKEEKLFSSFCRRITSKLNEDIPNFNMTAINSATLNVIMKKIEKALFMYTF